MLAGVPAGVAGGSPAAALHLPTRLLVWWIALVARTSARAPLGRLGVGSVVAIGVCVALAVVIARLRVAALAAALALALVRSPPADGREIVSGARLWRSGGTTVLIVDQPRPDRLLAALRAASVTRISVLVEAGSGSRTAQAIAPVRSRIAVDAVVTSTVAPGTTIRAGPFTVVVQATVPKLDVLVETARNGG
jgi:hypothetical protein